MQICSQTLVSLKNWLQLITIQKTSTAFGKREVKVIKGEMRTPQPSRVQKKKFKGRKRPQCEGESMERIKPTFWPLKYLYIRRLISSFLVHKSWENGDCVQTADEEEHQLQATETSSAGKWVSE